MTVSSRPSLLREFLVLASVEVQGMLLSVRAALVVFVYGATVFGIGFGYTKITDAIAEKIAKESPALALIDKKAVLDHLLKDEGFRKLFDVALVRMGGMETLEAIRSGRLPLIVLFVLLFSTFVLPGLVHLVGYDRVSEDLSTKYSRFVLQRVHRGTYLLAKWMSHWIVVWVLVSIVQCVLIAIAAFWSDSFDWRRTMAIYPTVCLGMGIFLLAYSGYTLLCSSLLVPPFSALALGMVGLVLLWILSFFWLNGVWMGTWDSALWVLRPMAIGVFFAHAAAFGGLAFYFFAKRDV